MEQALALEFEQEADKGNVGDQEESESHEEEAEDGEGDGEGEDDGEGDGEGENEGAEEGEGGQAVSSSLQRHRRALNQEMAQLDLLRSSLRRRDLASPLATPPRPPPQPPADQSREASGLSGLVLQGTPAPVWPASLPPSSGRASDIIQAGLAKAQPSRWDSKWKPLGARAA